MFVRLGINKLKQYQNCLLKKDNDRDYDVEYAVIHQNHNIGGDRSPHNIALIRTKKTVLFEGLYRQIGQYIYHNLDLTFSFRSYPSRLFASKPKSSTNGTTNIRRCRLEWF